MAGPDAGAFEGVAVDGADVVGADTEGAVAAFVVSVGTSSAQLWVALFPAGVAVRPVSVSAGSRGTCWTSTQPSGPEVTELLRLLLWFQLLSAAALAAPALVLLASGTDGVSKWEESPPPFTLASGAAAASISVRPAWTAVGSLPIGSELSLTGALSDCATLSTQASSAAYSGLVANGCITNMFD